MNTKTLCVVTMLALSLLRHSALAQQPPPPPAAPAPVPPAPDKAAPAPPAHAAPTPAPAPSPPATPTPTTPAPAPPAPAAPAHAGTSPATSAPSTPIAAGFHGVVKVKPGEKNVEMITFRGQATDDGEEPKFITVKPDESGYFSSEKPLPENPTIEITPCTELASLQMTGLKGGNNEALVDLGAKFDLAHLTVTPFDTDTLSLGNQFKLSNTLGGVDMGCHKDQPSVGGKQ